MLCAAVIMLSVAVWFNARSINRLTDLAIEQGKLNLEVAAALSGQGMLNNHQEKINDRVIKTFGMMLR